MLMRWRTALHQSRQYNAALQQLQKVQRQSANLPPHKQAEVCLSRALCADRRTDPLCTINQGYSSALRGCSITVVHSEGVQLQ